MSTDERNGRTFDEPEVRRIIETAASIQARAGTRISRAELESIAADLGIGREAIAQAIESVATETAVRSASADRPATSGGRMLMRASAAFGMAVCVLLVVVFVARMLIPRGF